MKNKLYVRLPKFVLLATLSPFALKANPLREVLMNGANPAKVQMEISKEESQVLLACLLTCGQSCSHTDNC